MKFINKRIVDDKFNENIEFLQKLKNSITELRFIYEKIPDDKMKRYIRDICKTTDRIMQGLIDDGSRLSGLKLFIEYYLPELIEILNQYMIIKTSRISGEQSDHIILQVEDFIPKAQRAFDRIYEDLIVNKNLDTKTDINIMLNELKSKRFL